MPIIVISKPMTLLIRSSENSKIYQGYFTVALTNVVVNHALRFFYIFSRFCRFVFQSIQFFRHPRKFLDTTRLGSQHKFFKTKPCNVIKKGQIGQIHHARKDIPVSQTKFVSFRLTVSSHESYPLPKIYIIFR
jgi:hypothetical protein